MPTAPLVSVLLAVHNGEPYLRTAIESVLRQTVTDLELLVVDDASTDATPAVLAGIGDETATSAANRRAAGSRALLEPRARRRAGKIRCSPGCGRCGPAGSDRRAAAPDPVPSDGGDRRLGRDGARRRRAARPFACDAHRAGCGSLGDALQLSLLPSDGSRRAACARTRTACDTTSTSRRARTTSCGRDCSR